MKDAYFEDNGVTVYHGEALATLREMSNESVNCIVTSPPYWGLRDYGTGSWEGGDDSCSHTRPSREDQEKAVAKSTLISEIPTPVQEKDKPKTDALTLK